METKFNFNSQVCTNKVQSERLLALGLKTETADMSHTAIVRNHKVEYREDCSTAKGMDIPAWSLHRLIEMMPDLIKDNIEGMLYHLSIDGNSVFMKQGIMIYVNSLGIIFISASLTALNG